MAVEVAKLSTEYSSFTLATVPRVVQVIVRSSFVIQRSPPLGAVTVNAAAMAKFASETSPTALLFTSVTRTLTVEEIASGTVQAKLPPTLLTLGAEAAISVAVAKLSREYSIFTFVIVPPETQLSVWGLPTCQASPPFGVVRVKAAWILKFASELSEAAGSETSVTRTFTVVEIASGMVQVYEPVFGAEALITAAVAKLSLEYSSFTLATVPVAVQVIGWVLATFHFSPPLGLSSVIKDVILKVASERSFASGSVTSETRTFTVAEIASGIVQVYVPVFGVDATITVEVAKSSFEYSSFTFAMVPVLVQVIGLTLPTAHCSPPLGLVTVRAPSILNGLSERSFGSGSFGSEIRSLMSYAEEMSFGTVQEKLPPVGFAGADAAISVKVT